MLGRLLHLEYIRSDVMGILVGIDPGFKGALAAYDTEQKTLEVFDMPLSHEVLSNGKKRPRLNLPLLFEWLRSRGSINFALIEKVTAAPNQGVTSMFRFGFQLGALEALLTSESVPYALIPALSWKMQLGLIHGSKHESRARAAILFPAYSAAFSRSKDDGRAEASLLAALASIQFAHNRARLNRNPSVDTQPTPKPLKSL